MPDEQLKKLEKKLDTLISGVHSQMLVLHESTRDDIRIVAEGVGVLGANVAGLDAKVAGLGAKVAGLDVKVAGLDVKVAGLGAKVAGLGAKVAGLDARMERGFKAVRRDLAGHERRLGMSDKQRKGRPS